MAMQKVPLFCKREYDNRIFCVYFIVFKIATKGSQTSAEIRPISDWPIKAEKDGPRYYDIICAKRAFCTKGYHKRSFQNSKTTENFLKDFKRKRYLLKYCS